MDPKVVADEATWFLIQAVESWGEQVWDEPADLPVTARAGVGRSLLTLFLRRADAGPTGTGVGSSAGDAPIRTAWARVAVEYAIDVLVQGPTDEQARAELGSAVRTLLDADPDLAADVRELVERAAEDVPPAEEEVAVYRPGRDAEVRGQPCEANDHEWERGMVDVEESVRLYAELAQQFPGRYAEDLTSAKRARRDLLTRLDRADDTQDG